MSTRYVNAADGVPEPVWVAGTRLLPFSLGHHLLFKRLGLPFAGCPDADCLPGHVLLGLLICAQPYETTLEQMHSATWDDTQREWLAAVMKRGTKLDDTEKRFREYLATGYTTPPIYRSSGAGLKLSAPWECLLRVRLLMAGLSQSEILNGYLPQMWLDYFTALEVTAADECEDPKKWRPLFVTQDDAERIQQAKEAANGIG